MFGSSLEIDSYIICTHLSDKKRWQGFIEFHLRSVFLVSLYVYPRSIRTKKPFFVFFRYFCIYAALTVTFSFLMVVTFFVDIMSYQVKRIKLGRRDCLPFCFAPQPKEGVPAWDEPRPQTSNRVMKWWGKFLTHPVTKCVVICFSLLLLGAGIYGVTQVEEAFDRRILAKDDTYLK